MGYKEKIEKEKSGKCSNRYVGAVIEDVAKVLIQFADQEPEFGQAIEQSDKTLVQCCESCVKGIGAHASDLLVYKKAVKFYFATADVQFDMRIDLCGSNGHQPPPITKTDAKPSSTTVSLDDLLGL